MLINSYYTFLFLHFLTVQLQPPYGTIYPTRQAVLEGGLVKILCHSKGIPTWTHTGLVQGLWRYHHIVKKKYVHGHVVYIQDASQNHHFGWYMCKGTDENGLGFVRTARVFIGCKYLWIIGLLNFKTVIK